VAAGARHDLGQPEAAVVTLQVPELRAKGQAPWLARLRFAYAEALEAVGRHEEAARWHELAREADPDGLAGITPEVDADDVLVVDLLEDGDAEDDHNDPVGRRPQ